MAAPMDAKAFVHKDTFPVKIKQTAVEINGVKTELVCSQYQDRLFVIVTQYNKVGTLVNISSDKITDATGSASSMFSSDVLMGRDEPLTHVIARNLVTELSLNKPILLSLALKDSKPGTVKTLAKILPTLL